MNPANATDLHEWAVANRDMVPHLSILQSCAMEADKIIEFGTRGGVSTWALLDGLRPSGHMWSVDITDCTTSVPPRVRNDPRWTFIRGDDTNPSVLAKLPADADLVFIDTSHEYRHTKQELEFALSRKPTRILCHDAEWDGVARALVDFCNDHPWHVVSYLPAGDDAGPFGLAILEPVT